MSEDNKVIPVPVGPKGVELKDIDQMFRFAACYLQSGLAPTNIKNPQQLVIIWAQAAELGLSPMQALSGISVIGNRTGLMGDLALSMVRSSGLLAKRDVKYEGKGDTRVCHVTLQRKGEEEHTYSFSIEEARQAGIYERNINYKHYPDRMLYYRALGFGLRDEFTDVLKGMKITEELIDYAPELDEDQEKVRANQEATEKAKAEGVKFVQPTGGERPSPAEAVEPAFPSDASKPAEPAFASRLKQDYPPEDTVKQVEIPVVQSPPLPPERKTDPYVKEPPDVDDLDMSAPKQPAPKEEPQLDWKGHVIRSIEHVKFLNRKIGDLGPKELLVIETQWLPRVIAQWEDATDIQRADAEAFKLAIAFHKEQPPW